MRPKVYFALRLLAAVGVVLGLSGGTTQADDLRPSGTLTIDQVQVAFIGSGNLGGGMLYLNGRRYSFSVGGPGMRTGRSAASRPMTATSSASSG